MVGALQLGSLLYQSFTQTWVLRLLGGVSYAN